MLCVCVFTPVVCMNETICKMVFFVRANGYKKVSREKMRNRVEETEWGRQHEALRDRNWDIDGTHLWSVLGEHSYELIGAGLTALVQQAWTQELSSGRHLLGRKIR